MNRHLCFIVIALLTALLVTGCASLAPTDPFAPVAGEPAIASGPAVVGAAAWTPGEALTLPRAISLALACNPGLAASRLDTDALLAQRDVALAAGLPHLNLVGAYGHYSDDQRLSPATRNGEAGVFANDLVGTDLVLNLPLYTWGRLTHELRAAELLHLAASRQLGRDRDELVFNVTSLYYAILAQARVIDSLAFSREALEEHRKRVAELLAAQKVAKVDLLRTEVRLADLGQRLSRERNTRQVQLQVLAALLGIETTEPLALSGSLDGRARLPEPAAAENSLAVALSQRQDWAAAETALRAQAHRLDAARAGQWPTLSLQAAYGERWALAPGDRPAGADSREDTGRVGLVLDIPLFTGGAIEARVRQETATLDAARERLRQLRLHIRQEVETARLDVLSARDRVETTRMAIEQAQESLRIEREKYDRGKGAIVDVLDAQSAQLDSQTSYYRALADYAVASAQLHLAMGDVR